VAKTGPLYCATDKEIFDALASAPQLFGESALLGLAKARGIFYSPHTDRLRLCGDISSLGFGFDEIARIQGEFEKSSRSEKKTFKYLKTELSLEEFRSIAAQYKAEAEEEGERVAYSNVGTTDFSLSVKYDEVDFSKTRLRQRQRREAALEFKVRDGETVLIYPSNEKVNLVVESLIERARAEKKSQITVEEVDLSFIKDHELRTKFFQELMRSVPGFALEDVTHVQVDLENQSESDDLELTDEAADEKKAIEEEIKGIVKDIALHGTSLHTSDEYKRLREQGYFLTSIQWSARRKTSPFEIVQFDAGFDDPVAGVGYKYGVRTWKVALESGQYAKSWTTIPADDKTKLSSLLQQASMTVFMKVKNEFKGMSSTATGEPL
jgi:hypothetical protein